jgi:hypothetical protein
MGLNSCCYINVSINRAERALSFHVCYKVLEQLAIFRTFLKLIKIVQESVYQHLKDLMIIIHK